MIVDKFKLRSETAGDVAIFDFNNITPDTPYVLIGATGLSAETISPLNYARNATGINFYSMNLGSRTVTLKIGLNSSYSANGEKQDLRDDLYRSIYADHTATLWIDLYNGTNFLATIKGLVTKIESPLFSSKSEVEMVLVCEDPFFKKATPTNILSGAFSNGVLSENYQNGTAPTGFVASFLFQSPANYFGFFDPDNTWEFKVEKNFLAGDILSFSSIFSEKDIFVVRGTSTIKLGNSITMNSIWPILFPGANSFEINTSAGSSAVSFSGGFYYYSYWGV